MDPEHRERVTRTKDLIEHTRREIGVLRVEIRSARETIDRTVQLLSRKAAKRRRQAAANAL